MKCGIVGLPNVGKSTLFNCLSNAKALAANYPFATIEPNIGIIPVPDKRLMQLSSLINQIYGQQAMRPAQLVPKEKQGTLEPFLEEVEYLEEGLRDIFGKAVGLIKLGTTKLLSFAKNTLTKIRNFILKGAIRITKTIIKDKKHE